MNYFPTNTISSEESIQYLTIQTSFARRPDACDNRLSTGWHPRNNPWDWPRPWPPVVAVLSPPPAPLHGVEAAVVEDLHATQPPIGVEAIHVGTHAVVEV